MHASFFFIDIVGLSNPLLSTTTQSSKIKILNNSIAQCPSYESTPTKEKIVFPTGDGMWIAFLDGLEKPINLALELHQKLKKHNQEQTKNEQIQVRIGCHSGEVFFVNDLNGTVNLWGPGIIMARRVMDAGDAEHILMTSTMAENLIELSDEYRKIIHPIHDFKIKHGEVLLVYSAYGDNFGNSERPKKGLVVSKVDQNLESITPIVYNCLDLVVNLKNSETNICKISKTFAVENQSMNPIYEVSDTIQTHSKKLFGDLNVKAYDENNENLEIAGVNLDTENKKEFKLKLNKPIFQKDKNKKFTISYEIELKNNFFEEIFPINIEQLGIEFTFPTNVKIQPKLYLLTIKDRQKSIQEEVDLKRGISTQIKWNEIKNVEINDLVRLEW